MNPDEEQKKKVDELAEALSLILVCAIDENLINKQLTETDNEKRSGDTK